jgi:hypothetical protein
MDRAVVHPGKGCDMAVDKFNRTTQIDILIARLTELCDASAGSPQGQPNTTDRPGPSHIVELCTRFSECDLALFVHAQCRMNPCEIDHLYSMDMAAIDDWIAIECPPSRRKRIKPLHMVRVSLDQLRQRVLAELRLGLHEIDGMTKPQMIGYLCTVRPGLLKDWFIQGAVSPDQSSTYS